MPQIANLIFRNITFSNLEDKNRVFLTFDDGPHETISSWLLDYCKDQALSCTFFLTGSKMERLPKLLNERLIPSHSIGSHGYKHLSGWNTLTNEYLSSVIQWENTWSTLTGNLPCPTLFRPPYGRITPMQHNALCKRNYHIVMWSLMSYDFDLSIPEKKLVSMLNEKVKGGDIVVFHENARTVERLPQILPRFVDHCRKKGFSFGTIE